MSGGATRGRRATLNTWWPSLRGPTSAGRRPSLVPCWPCQSTVVLGPSVRRRIPRRRVENSAFARSTASRSAFDRARQYWIQPAACARGLPSTAHEKSAAAGQVNAVDINYGEDWTSGWRRLWQTRQSSSDSSVCVRCSLFGAAETPFPPEQSVLAHQTSPVIEST